MVKISRDQDQPEPQHVINGDDATFSDQLEGLLVINFIVDFIGIDKYKVKCAFMTLL